MSTGRDAQEEKEKNRDYYFEEARDGIFHSLFTNLAQYRRYDMDCHFLLDIPTVPTPLS